jgi:hypothetical protein
MDELIFKQKSRRIMTMMIIQVAGLTLGVIFVAILAGMWIGQLTGRQSFLNWLPLLISLPVNLWTSSRLGNRAVRRITTLRYSVSADPDQVNVDE